MKKRLVKPVNKTVIFKKAFLYNSPTRPNNENCDCCANKFICIKK